MFNKTRTRLTSLNSIVFFVILACFGVIIYLDLRHELYAKVDASIIARAQDFHGNFVYYSPKIDLPLSADSLPEKMVTKMLAIQVLDPRIFLILWDDQGNPIPLTPVVGGEKEAFSSFGEYRSTVSPETVTISGHVYRTFTVTYNQPQMMKVGPLIENLNNPKEPNIGVIGMTGSVESNRILSVQAISNVDSEQNMLRNLMRLILIGIILGGAAIFLAGLYLANQALLPIRRSWEKQQQFVADASHELRMPLSIIQANAELVFRHPDQSILDMSEPLSMVLKESKRMAKLTDQLLILARSDSDLEEIMLKPTFLDQIIQDVVQKYTPLAELKNLQMGIDLAFPFEIQGDRERLHQLLVILLDNSMKNTADNGTVRMSAHKSGNHAAIIVEDTGSGISAEDLPHIFDRFYRGDKSRSRSDGGTGLGLAIAKWIVDKHGGTIFAESQLGKGTTMTIHLPTGHK